MLESIPFGGDAGCRQMAYVGKHRSPGMSIVFDTNDAALFARAKLEAAIRQYRRVQLRRYGQAFTGMWYVERHAA